MLVSAKLPPGPRLKLIGSQASGVKSKDAIWVKGLMLDASALQIVIRISNPGVQPRPFTVSVSALLNDRFEVWTEIFPGVGSAV
jgi:hypothetical protein